uniref:Uncharacterized protein n=1 Tax=Arundo donax TaxID=35708 RepID=A0A0A8Z8K3_ARUDO
MQACKAIVVVNISFTRLYYLFEHHRTEPSSGSLSCREH